MPRKKLIRTNDYYYHITTRTNNKEWFALPLEEVWSICSYALRKAHSKTPVDISQFVLMANHYHLLVRTKNNDIDKFMFWLNREIGTIIRNKTNRINRVFATGYKWTLVTHPKYFKNVFKYIYQNPMRAGIVKRCEHYPYSSKYYIYKDLEIPFSFTPINHLETSLDFLNEMYTPHQNQVIRLGLSRTKYNESRLRSTPN